MVIDHRNYDYILATGCAPPGKNIYYKVTALQASLVEGEVTGGGCSVCLVPLQDRERADWHSVMGR